MNPLLILVDLQRDFLTANPLAPAAGDLVERASWLLGRCRERGIPVVHVWTTVSRRPDNRMAHWKQAGVWRCVAGTTGHEPPRELAPIEGETILHKTGFRAFAGGQLLGTIREQAADSLWVAGVHLHACVRQAVIEGYEAGFRVCVAEDATGSDDPVHAAITRRYLTARGVHFLRVQELADPRFMRENRGRGESRGERAVARAVGGAAGRARDWRWEPDELRTGFVEALAVRLTESQRELSALMAREIGKPIRHGRLEIQRTVEMLRDIVRCCRATRSAEGFAGGWVRRRPHGVVAVITPWNNPVYIALGKIVPAVMHGNSVVWKPAPEARTLSRRLQAMFEEAAMPEGLVVPLEGGRREAVQLMGDERVGAVTLTGSCAAGYSAQEICARRRIPLQAELGGNNAAIVWPDADLTAAAQRVAAGAFEMAGQRCTANRRVIVHEGCRDEFVERLRTQAAALNWGDPLDAETDIGPLVNERHRDRVARQVDRAVAACGPALLPHGAVSPAGEGCWYPPTVLPCEDPALEIVQEETFGPVLVVQTARDWAQAIDLCNRVRQGLAAAIFTRSPEIQRRFLEEANAGILKVNQSTADAAVGVPFGGWKASGLGPPEHGVGDAEFFSRSQTVYGDLGSPAE
jgi:acyl-CoA reductase-like NAD-dependent aldehyde dehydrogenase